jgi:hypothetical protein
MPKGNHNLPAYLHPRWLDWPVVVHSLRTAVAAIVSVAVARLARRRVAAHITIAVGMEAQKGGVASKLSEDELRRRVTNTQWIPTYASLNGIGK